jgi:LacI family transcriptional regulator
MDKRITIYDIADKLNLSTTTVFRAINNKPRVSDKTKRLVLETAEAMGFKVNKAAKSLARNTIKLCFIIGYRVPVFHDEVIRGVKAASEELADFNMRLECHIVEDKIAARYSILTLIKEAAESGCQGILLLPSPDMRGYHELISDLTGNNHIQIALIGTDIPGSNKLFSLRQDGMTSGSLAAELLWWFTERKSVVVFTGYKDIGIHAEVLDGFYRGCRKYPLNILDVLENHDDSDLAYYNTEKAIRLYPELEGIYINSANSLTVCQKLEELGLGGKIKVVASDVFPELLKYMRQGIVHASIFQDPFNQGRRALKQLYGCIAEGEVCEKNILVRPQVVLHSNMDTFIG